INQLPHDDVNTAYADLIRCVQYASSTEVICEADALRDLLLSIVAPAHARLKSGESSTNFNILARSILGERSKIFGLVIEGEKLVISIESNILNVKGFPVSIGKDDDVLKCINAALASNL
ncbi:AAA family ATPase, partial [Enterobacter hormaechei]